MSMPWLICRHERPIEAFPAETVDTALAVHRHKHGDEPGG